MSKRLLGALAVVLACALSLPAGASASGQSFLGSLSSVSPIGTTVPGNGDLNPYGIVNVEHSIGSLMRGDVLISNFNNKENEQGTGSTLVQLTPSGSLSVFAEITTASAPGCTGGIGLTTALSILPDGYVVVGSLPTSDGKADTAMAGCLIVLNPTGQVVRTISGDPINGPWDMTAVSFGPLTELFVTNVLNGTVEHGETGFTPGGTVVRIGVFTPHIGPPVFFSEQVIANGFPERTDKTALVIGPTGVGVGLFGTLFVADTLGNRIAAVPGALFRTKPSKGGITVAEGGSLHGPLGLAIAPNGNILTTNGGDSNIVETTPFGHELAAFDTKAEEGGLFGLTVTPDQRGIYFVNDNKNKLELAH
jgi:hypothetical protein